MENKNNTSNTLFIEEKKYSKAKYKGSRSPVEILFPHMSSCSLVFGTSSASHIDKNVFLNILARGCCHKHFQITVSTKY